AEDGIRDKLVTGVQTCALPICKQGKPLLSWRVHLLPFLEQDNLYKQFHLDEPWDSEHNKKLIARMPPVYRSSDKVAADGRTTFRSEERRVGKEGRYALWP